MFKLNASIVIMVREPLSIYAEAKLKLNFLHF